MKLGLTILALTAWTMLVWLIMTWTGWTFEDPGTWALVILGMPVGMLVAAFIPRGK